MGKILDESLFSKNSTEQTMGLTSSFGSPAAVKTGFNILLHCSVTVSFFNYVFELDQVFLKIELFVSPPNNTKLTFSSSIDYEVGNFGGHCTIYYRN